MNGQQDEGPQRFPRSPRGGSEADRRESAWTRFLESLEDIDSYLAVARHGGPDEFEPRTARYAAASLAIVRVASLFENGDFAVYLGSVPDGARRGVIATRNIVARAGYMAMDDELFWRTIDVDLPPLLERLRDTGL